MEQMNNAMRILGMLERPAFMASEGKILHANPMAEALHIASNSALEPLLANAKDAYEAFTDGVLQITLWVHGRSISAIVEKMDGYDLFLLDPPQPDKQLEVLAAASTQLRAHLAGLMHNAANRSPQANRSLCQLHRALSNMSDASRYSVDHTAQLQVFEICSWLQELAESVAAHAESLGIQLQYKCPSGQLYCPIDEELLRRAILNLIANAIQAGSTILELSVTKQAKTLSITLSDNGKGVAADLRADLFCKYKQSPTALNWSYGLGLGMIIVKAAANAHKGTVLLKHRSEGGLQATITVSTEQNQLMLRSPTMRIEYLGGRDTVLTELSDVLPPEKYAEISRP